MGLNSGTTGAVPTCYACGIAGHVARSCPTASTINFAGESESVGVIGEIGEMTGGEGQFGGRGGFRGRGGRGRGIRGNGFIRGARGGARGGFVGSAEPRVCYNCNELNQ